MSGKTVGALVGALGGLAFILSHASQFPDLWAWPIRGLGLVAFVWAVNGLRQPGRLPAGKRPDARSWRTYQATLLAMMLAIPLGSGLLTRAGLGTWTILWVIFVVGVHWFPFAPAFGAPQFRSLGTGMVLAAAVGAVLKLLGLPWGGAAGAVAAGFVMLAYSGGFGQPPRTEGPAR